MRRQLGLPPTGANDATTVDWTLTAPTELDHKRIEPRVTTIISAATPIFNTDQCECLDITDLVEDVVSMTAGMTGTPHNFQKLMVRIFSRSAHTILWGDAFEDSGVARLLEITQPGMTHQVGLEYNPARERWTCLATDVLGH